MAGATMSATAPGHTGLRQPTAPAGKASSARRRALLAPVTAGVIIVLGWQLAASAFAPSYIARPLQTLREFPAVLGDGQFLSAAASTLLAVLEGLVIAVLAGTAIGLVMGRMRGIDRLLRLYVDSFYAMPLVALVPLLTVWFGYTPAARLAVVVIEAALPIVYSVAEGGRHLDSSYIDVTRAYRAPWWRVWTGVALPASTPYLLGGIDLAVGRALIGAVVVEFIAGLNGLGYYILFHVRSFQQDKAMVAVCVLVAFALVLRRAVGVAVRRGLPWYQGT